GLDLDVSGLVGLTMRWRGVEIGTTQEHDIHRHVIGNQLNDPALFGQSVVRLLPFDRILESRQGLPDHLVQSFDDGLEVRHNPSHPIVNFGVTVGRDRRNPARKSLWSLLGHNVFYPKQPGNQTAGSNAGCVQVWLSPGSTAPAQSGARCCRWLDRRPDLTVCDWVCRSLTSAGR